MLLFDRLWLLPATLTLAWCFAACQHDSTVQQQNETDDPVLSDYRVIQALGYNITDVYDAGDYYVVEGDIVLDKDKLQDYSDIQTRQGYHSKLGPQYQTINVRVEGYFLQQYFYSAVKSAMKAWNDVGSNITFVDVTNDNTKFADVQFGSMGLPTDRFAEVRVPSDGKPYFFLHINDMAFKTTLTDDQKKMQAVHVLGHAIGLAHTRITGTETEGYAEDADKTGYGTDIGQYWDNESVMVKSNYSKSFSALSLGDITALKLLYPNEKTPLAINGLTIMHGSSLYAGANIVLEASATITGPSDRKISYKWECANMEIVSGPGTSKPTVKFSQPGNYQIKVTVTTSSDYATPNSVSQSATKTISITQAPPTIKNLKIIGPPDGIFQQNERTQYTASYEIENDVPGSSISFAWSGSTLSSNCNDILTVVSGQGTNSIIGYFNQGGYKYIDVTATYTAPNNSPSTLKAQSSFRSNLIITYEDISGGNIITGKTIRFKAKDINYPNSTIRWDSFYENEGAYDIKQRGNDFIDIYFYIPSIYGVTCTAMSGSYTSYVTMCATIGGNAIQRPGPGDPIGPGDIVR